MRGRDFAWMAVLVAAIAASGMFAPGQALAVTYAVSDGFGRSATAEFTADGNLLHVRLANTSVVPAADRTFVLTAVFFEYLPPMTFTPLSAVLAPGSHVYDYGQSAIQVDPVGGNVGGEWAYRQTDWPFPTTEGTSSTGLGLFGPNDLFGGDNLASAASPNGVEYGIVGPGGVVMSDSAAANGGLRVHLIQNAVDFTLSDGIIDLDRISMVAFLYGTDRAGPLLMIPEPLTMLGVAIGLAGLAGYVRRRRQA